MSQITSNGGKAKKEIFIEVNLDKFINNDEYRKEVVGKIIKEWRTTVEGARPRRLVEPEIKMLIMRKSVRRQMLQTCGKEAFLLPDAEPYPKFPVMAPIIDERGNVVKCEPHCGLVVAAYYRANEWMFKHPEYKKVAEKAKELYKKWHCDEKVPIHIDEAILNENGNETESIEIVLVEEGIIDNQTDKNDTGNEDKKEIYRSNDFEKVIEFLKHLVGIQ